MKEGADMPALYAHNRFGKQVFQNLDGEVKDVIRNHYTQFRVGLQGPDILFFYRPWGKNRVSQIGYRMHDTSAYKVFEKAAELIRKKGMHSREYAYVLGFMCHFILDSECHPYVNYMTKKIKVGHTEIEAEYEKELLRKDGREPLVYPVWRYLPKDELTVRTVQSFFSEISKEEVKEALVSYRLIKRVLTSSNKCYHKFFDAILKPLGHYGLMHPYYDNPKCEKTNNELHKRYGEAITLAVEMIEDFHETVKGKRKLNERFDRTFD